MWKETTRKIVPLPVRPQAKPLWWAGAALFLLASAGGLGLRDDSSALAKGAGLLLVLMAAILGILAGYALVSTRRRGR